MASLYNLSWTRTSFFSKLLLFVRANAHQRKRIRSADAREKASGYSALSSTYYSIVGTAGAQWKAIQKPGLGLIRIPWFLATWLPLGVWCNWRMLYLSDRVVDLIGYGMMTASECDVRQSILRRRSRWAEAKRCIEAGLRKEARDTHTLGLLHVAYVDILRREGNRQEAVVHARAALGAAMAAERTDPRQASRIYRHCAEHADWMHMTSPFTSAELWQKARDLAAATGADDQLLKLGD